MWKLEPQRRQAPHFHALCWGVSRIPWQWLAVRWACIIHGIRGPKNFPTGPGKSGAAEFREWLDNTSTLPDEVKESIRVGTKDREAALLEWSCLLRCEIHFQGVEGGWENAGRYWALWAVLKCRGPRSGRSSLTFGPPSLSAVLPVVT